MLTARKRLTRFRAYHPHLARWPRLARWLRDDAPLVVLSVAAWWLFFKLAFSTFKVK